MHVFMADVFVVATITTTINAGKEQTNVRTDSGSNVHTEFRIRIIINKGLS